ncbi:MAG: ribonuclease P protein component [Chloroflexi bacterium]|nr:ribonuclease P protein component [Chloroflexota bacterium]|tara:strand:- start:2311 stop:2655 length:345 start_codon:yes stop_codon:yes gene_type:complete
MIGYDNQIIRLKKNTDFRLVWSSGKKKISDNLILIYVKNSQKYTRVGISSVKNYGNSVQRNKITRRIRSIIRNANIIYGNDIVIMARKKSKESKFSIIEEELNRLLTSAGLTSR